MNPPFPNIVDEMHPVYGSFVDFTPRGARRVSIAVTVIAELQRPAHCDPRITVGLHPDANSEVDPFFGIDVSPDAAKQLANNLIDAADEVEQEIADTAAGVSTHLFFGQCIELKADENWEIGWRRLMTTDVVAAEVVAAEVVEPAGVVEFFVPGRPAPQGSKRHVGHGIMVESSREVGPWRERVALAAHNAMAGSELLTGAVTLALTFVLPRPKSTPKRRTPAATKRPDVDKLARATLDAITGTVVADDSQIVDLHATKRLAELGENPGVNVWVGAALDAAG